MWCFGPLTFAELVLTATHFKGTPLSRARERVYWHRNGLPERAFKRVLITRIQYRNAKIANSRGEGYTGNAISHER